MNITPVCFLAVLESFLV